MADINIGELEATLKLRDDMSAKLKDAVGLIDKLGVTVDDVGKDVLGFAQTFEKFGGGESLKNANMAVLAVEKLGGAARLTESEQRKLNAQLVEAIAKYKALGQEAPASMLALEQATRKVETTTVVAAKQVGFFQKTWQDVGTQIKATIIGFVSAQAIIATVSAAWRTLTSFVSSSIDSFATSEAAQNKLTHALQNQGVAVDAAIAQYNALSAEFQRTTTFSDDLITEMQALLVQVGQVMPADMKDALTAATDLSVGLGIDLRDATMMLAKAFAGGGDELGRLKATLGDAMVEGTGMVGVMAAINEKFGGSAQNEINSYAGEVKQLANEWDNLKEEVGGVVVELNKNLGILALTRIGIAALTEKSKQWGQSLVDNVPEIARLLGWVQTLGKEQQAQDERTKNTAQESARYADILKRIQTEVSKLTNEQKKLIVEMDKAELSTKDITQTTGVSERAIRLYLAQVQQSAKAQKESAKAAKEAGKEAADYAKKISELSKNIETATQRGTPMSVMLELFGNKAHDATLEADAMGKAVTTSIRDMAAALHQAKLDEIITDAAAAMHKMAVESQQAFTADQGKQLQQQNQAIIDNFNAMIAAQRNAIVTTQRMVMSDAAFKIAQANRATDDQLKALDRNVGNWKEAEAAILTDYRATIDLLVTEHMEALIDMGQATKKTGIWAGFLQGATDTLKKLPDVILRAVQGGGNIGQTIGAFIGGEIGKSIGEKLAKSLGVKLGESIGNAIGAVIPVIGTIAGGLVGKLFDKIFGPSEREKVIHMRREILGAGLAVTDFEKRAAAAGVPLDKLWKSDNVKGFEREVKKATLAIEEFEARIAGVTKASEGLTLRAQGFAMPFEKPLSELAELRGQLPELEKDLAAAMTGGKGTELEILNADKAVTSAKGAISAIQAELQKAKAKGDTGLVATLSGDLKIAQLEADELVKKLEILKTGADPAAISKAQAALDLANANIALITGNLDVLKTQGSGAFERIGAMAVNQFGIILSQTGDLNQAFAAVGPALDILVGLQKDLGFEASGAVQSLLGLRQVATTNQDITDSVSGITLMMKELGKVGLVNQVTFDNFGADAVSLFDTMKGRGVSAKDSLLLMQPALQQLWQLQKDFGFETDEATQGLIDMAAQNGIVGTNFQDSGQKMFDIMVEIKDILIIVGETLKKGIGGGLDNVGSELAENKGDWKSWSSTAVGEVGEVAEAVDTVTFGSSPGGIKEWKPRILEAADAMKDFRTIAVRELDGVSRAVNQMGDAVKFLANDLDALGLTSEDIDRIRKTDPAALSRLAREAGEIERQRKAMRAGGGGGRGTEGPTPVGDVSYPWQPVPGEMKSGRQISMSQQNEINVNMTGVDPFDQRDLDDKMRRIALPILIDALDKDYGRSRQNMLKALRLD